MIMKKNINYITSSGVNLRRTFALVGTVSADSNGIITSLNPKTTFRAVDYNDFQTLNNNALLDSDKKTITSWGFPSTNNKTFTLGSSGATYTAPDDGWFCVSLDTKGSGCYGAFYRNNILIHHQETDKQNQTFCIFAPFAKGDILKISYANISLQSFRFYYTKGVI